MHATLSDAIVDVADFILANVASLSTTEISKRGRKYRFVNNSFQRVREEDKHLVVYPEKMHDHVSVVLAYNILSGILSDIFNTHKDLCLIVIGVARALEEHHWYEEENSSVVHYAVLQSSVDFSLAEQALAFAENVTPDHLEQGYNLLYCSKLNFLHTDHHVGSKLEGHFMREYVARYFGDDALELPIILSALKSFSHWAHIKGLLYKLGVPYMDVDEGFKLRFASFPDPPEELAEHVHDRFPSGTSKYALACKALDHLAQFKYARLIPYPQTANCDPRWLYDLCEDIHRDPAKYHLRSKAKKLSPTPANLQELSHSRREHLHALYLVVSLVLSVFPEIGGEYFLQNSKFPPVSDELISIYPEYYESLQEVAQEVSQYEDKGWNVDDILLRVHKGHVNSWYDEVEKARNGP